jgi:hypothetical protein
MMAILFAEEVVMDNDKVMVGVGKCFSKFLNVTDSMAQEWIKRVTGTVVPIEQIRECFDLLETGDFIIIHTKNEFEYSAVRAMNN